MRATSQFLLFVLLCGLAVSGLAQTQNIQPSPRVVAQISLTDQTGSLPRRNLFTPQKDGLFRLSVYLIPTQNTSDVGAFFSVFYTDEAGPESQDYLLAGRGGVGCMNNNGAAPCFMTALVRAKAGTPIAWETTTQSGVTYEVFGTLEKLLPLE